MKTKTLLLLLFGLLLNLTANSQGDCDLKQSNHNEIFAIDTADIKCIAKSSSKKNTLFFTFGIWCAPCRAHLPNAIKTAQENDLDFYVLLVEAEDDIKTTQAIEYLRKVKENVNIVILKDQIYGTKRSKKNQRFVTEITPPEFENIDDYSKYILLDKTGKVIMVTNWKDNHDNEWRDDTEMIKKRILPLL